MSELTLHFQPSADVLPFETPSHILLSTGSKSLRRAYELDGVHLSFITTGLHSPAINVLVLMTVSEHSQF